MFRPTYITNTAPTVNDDFSAGFREGNYWMDTSTDILYLLGSDAVGAANWVALSTSVSVTDWTNWTPTFAWTPAAPAAPTYVARYWVIDNKVNFYLDLQGTNDSGSVITNLTATPPVTIVDTNSLNPCPSSYDNAGTTSPTIRSVGIIDQETASRKIIVTSMSIPNTNDYRIIVSGFYEKA